MGSFLKLVFFFIFSHFHFIAGGLYFLSLAGKSVNLGRKNTRFIFLLKLCSLGGFLG